MFGNRAATIKGRIFNTAKADSTDLFSSDLSPSTTGPSRSSLFRITIAVNTTSTLNHMVTNDATTVSAAMNDGIALSANQEYVLYHEAQPGDTVNYQLGTAATVLWMYVSEVIAEAV